MRRWVAVATGFLTMLVGAFLDRRGLGDRTLERRLDTWTVTTVLARSVIAVCRDTGGSSATVDGGPPIPLARIEAGGYGLEPLSSGVRVVPAPGAVVVAGTSRAAPVVQGLS